jgi:hypothetical protein
MIRARSIFVRFACFTLAASFLVACSGGPSSSPTPTPSPSPTPAVSEHLYVGSPDQNGNQQLLLFNLPLASNSTPSVTASPLLGNSIAVDSNGNVATRDFQCHISLYSAPISGSLTPSATFNNGANCLPNQIGGLAFSPSGDLFAPERIKSISLPVRSPLPARYLKQLPAQECRHASSFLI